MGLTASAHLIFSSSVREMILLPAARVVFLPALSISSQFLPCLSIHSLFTRSIIILTLFGRLFHFSLFMTTKKPVLYAEPQLSVVNFTTSPHRQVLSDSMGAIEPSTTPRLRAS